MSKNPSAGLFPHRRMCGTSGIHLHSTAQPREVFCPALGNGDQEWRKDTRILCRELRAKGIREGSEMEDLTMHEQVVCFWRVSCPALGIGDQVCRMGNRILCSSGTPGPCKFSSGMRNIPALLTEMTQEKGQGGELERGELRACPWGREDSTCL